LTAALSRRMPPSHTQSLPSMIPSTKASGAEGSATISAAVESMKSSPTTFIPSLVAFRDPIPLEETPSLTPSLMRDSAILPIGVERIFALPIKLVPLAKRFCD